MASTLTNFRLGVLSEAELQRPCLVLVSSDNELEPELQESSEYRARVAPNKESLKGIAETLQEVLLAAQEAASQSYDVDPGESSDEEGGSSEGLRLRVRLQRCSDDKWGIKWHKQMFKSSHRLVVDEIAPGSPLDRWNASQPQGLQVKYGDRLERLNGIRVKSSPAEVAGKFRAELQKEEMRALFWRPGQAKKPDAVSAPRVLVVASEGCGGLAAAAAVVAAHLVLYSKATVTAAVQLVGEVAEPWLHCLEEMAPTSELEQPLEAPQVEGGCGLDTSPAEEKDGEDRQIEEASLEANSVGFYQITKLLIIPTVIGLERLQGRRAVYSQKVILSIVVTGVGVALATVSDFEVNVRGSILALMSIISTAQYQIWQGSKQHEHGVTPTQITYSVAWPQSCAGLVCALLADVWLPQVKVLFLMRPSTLLEHKLSGQGDLYWIVLCNLLAVCTNISVYGLIGKTSPITYQVVGQLKTVMVVAFGYIFFDVRVPWQWLLLRFTGVAIAIVGVISYAIIKNAEAKDKKT